MKSLQTIFTAVLLITILPAQGDEETAVYLASDVDSSGGGMLWRDSTGNHNLQIADPAGVSTGERPSVGDDEKSVVFDGTQTMPFRSTSSIAAPSNGLRATLSLRPDSEGGAEQTVLRHGNWELRYSAETQRLQFIVWHGEGDSYTNVYAAAELGIWSEVEAAYENGLLKLSVNGKEETSQSKGELSSRYPDSALFVGASTGIGIGVRPLRGALAGIRISVD